MGNLKTYLISAITGLLILTITSCNYSEIQNGVHKYLSGITSERLATLKQDYPKYVEDAKMKDTYKRDLERLKSQVINMSGYWAVLPGGGGGFQLSTGRYFSTSDLRNEANAIKQIPSAERRIEWAQFCETHVREIPILITNLEDLTNALEKYFNKWDVRKLQEDLYLITGYGLGLYSGKVDIGQWYFIVSANRAEPADALAQNLLDRIDKLTANYDTDKKRYRLD